MSIEKLKKDTGYNGKPQQWQYGFDLACRESNKRFADFIDQAIHDSACAEERQTLQRLLEDFNATLK